MYSYFRVLHLKEKTVFYKSQTSFLKTYILFSYLNLVHCMYRVVLYVLRKWHKYVYIMETVMKYVFFFERFWRDLNLACCGPILIHKQPLFGLISLAFYYAYGK